MRHCHAIVRIVPTIARRIAHVTSRNDAARIAIVVGIAAGWVALTLRIAAVTRVAVLSRENTAHIATTRPARVVPRRIVAASKTILATPGHSIARLGVFFRVACTIGNVGSSSICVSVVEAHDVGRGIVGTLRRKEPGTEDYSIYQK